MKYIKIPLFTAQTGWTENAVRRKIEDGVWVKDREWRKAPDGSIHIDVEGYREWLGPGGKVEFSPDGEPSVFRPPVKPEPKLRVTRGPGRIYFIQAAGSGALKIGFSLDPPRRLRMLQTSNAEKLVLLASIAGAMADEGALQKRFAAHRLMGEWFRPAPEILDYIESAEKVAQ